MTIIHSWSFYPPCQGGTDGHMTYFKRYIRGRLFSELLEKPHSSLEKIRGRDSLSCLVWLWIHNTTRRSSIKLMVMLQVSKVKVRMWLFRVISDSYAGQLPKLTLPLEFKLHEVILFLIVKTYFFYYL